MLLNVAYGSKCLEKNCRLVAMSSFAVWYLTTVIAAATEHFTLAWIA